MQNSEQLYITAQKFNFYHKCVYACILHSYLNPLLSALSLLVIALVLQKKFRAGLARSNPDDATITTALMTTKVFKNIDTPPDISCIC